MENLHQPIIDFIRHYADELNNGRVREILNRMEVTSEAEARQIMAFLNDMTEQVKKDVEQEKSILGTKVTYYDASKVCFEMEQQLEELGYESILDEDRPNIE